MDPSRSTLPSASRRDAQQLSRQRQQYRDQIFSKHKEDDPLNAYDQFIQWTIQNYGEDDPESGLFELLEETTRNFKDDASYKNDQRYLKIWSLYAHQIEEPATVYAFLIANEIGTTYSALYEEYANVLERDGLYADADKVYRMGLKRNPRSLGRLKSCYKEFKSRISSSSIVPAPSAKPSASESRITSNLENLRPNPLDTPAQTHPSSANAPSPNFSPSARYAVMLAPPVPGRRPEKLRFDLSLLFTEDGKEYSIQEARARFMGLLGRKWGPPPATERPLNRNRVDQNTTLARRTLMGEPTVTINTKEALADVFGMYNSPDKTRRIVPGSKHAPLKKVEPITPVVRKPQAQIRTPSNGEFAAHATKTPNSAFRPFVDDHRKENATPAPKFKPFVDPAPPNVTPFIAPEHRRVLSVKEPGSVPPKSTEISNEDPFKPSATPKPVPEDNNAVFRKVFTPVAAKTPSRDFPKEEQVQVPKQSPAQVQDLLSPTPAPQNVRASAASVPGSSFMPFRNAVFSRPPAQSDKAVTKSSTSPPISVSKIVPSTSTTTEHRAPLRPTAIEPGQREDDDDNDDGEEDVMTEDFQAANDMPLGEDGEEYEDGASFREVPLGGRFGQFNVMTPITERTFEFTTSTRASICNTPRDHSLILDGERTVGQRDEYAAIENAERLAAELREEELHTEYIETEYAPPRDGFDDSDSSFTSGDDDVHHLHSNLVDDPSGDDLQYIEEKTGTLSLIDAMTLSSTFKPANPCNPFDPPIVLTLLSLMPSDREYHDFRDREAKLLDGLQRFAKRARKASGDTNITGNLSLTSCFPLTLGHRRFNVLQKLGEGGFGAVFQAQDISSKGSPDDDDDDEDMDEDELPMVAVKVVKPRNIWEYHILRRLHVSLPPHLRRSVISPQALYAFRDESFLILDLCAQGTLLDVVNNAGSAGVSQQGACLDELLVMFFSIELLRLVEGMHSAGFIHGDLKIDNCLLRLEDVPGGASAWSSLYQPSGEGGWSHKGIRMIDFGRTIDTKSFPPGQKFIAEWSIDERDCLEMRENRPWTFQTDYFGLAGIIYCMLFGKYIQNASITTSTSETGKRYRIATPFKRYWQSDLWTRLFDLLLNPTLARPTGHLPVCEELRVLRTEMETWLKSNCNRTSNTLKGLLKKVEVSVWRGR